LLVFDRVIFVIFYLSGTKYVSLVSSFSLKIVGIDQYSLTFVITCVVELQRQLLIQRRGATLALTAIARDTGTDLQEKLPSFWDAMFASLTVVSGKVIY